MVGGPRTVRFARGWLGLAVCLTAVIVLAPTAHAAFPQAKNGRIVFERQTAPGVRGEVMIMKSDGSGLTNLTNTPTPLTEQSPVFSPTGRSIAFERYDGSQFDLWLMKPDGSEQVNLTNTANPIYEENPDFSPDGTQLVFDRSSGAARDLFVMNLDGSGEVNLTNTPGQSEVNATWAPDGRGVYFNRPSGMFSSELWFVNADGSGQVQVAPPGDGSPQQAAASPDGAKLAYSRCAFIFCTRVVVLDLVTGAESTLPPATQDDRNAVFSPDMKQFVFMGDTDPDVSEAFAIFLMNSDGANPKPLTSVPLTQDDVNPDWEYVFRCGKRRATIVGDDGPDTIRGTRKRDVIVANGDRDVVRGRGGNDRICLGGGRDRAIGGKGNDRCIGGKGKDKGKGCEQGKL